MFKAPKNTFTLYPEYSPSEKSKSDYNFGNYLVFSSTQDNTAGSTKIKFGNGTNGSYHALRRAQTQEGTITVIRFKALSEAHMDAIENAVHVAFVDAGVATFRKNGKQAETAIIDRDSLTDAIQAIKDLVASIGGTEV